MSKILSLILLHLPPRGCIILKGVKLIKLNTKIYNEIVYNLKNQLISSGHAIKTPKMLEKYTKKIQIYFISVTHYITNREI